MKKVNLIVMLFLILFFSSAGFTETSKVQPTLIKKWETLGELKIPESVIYDAKMDVLFASNINGGALEKNGAGFISMVLCDGKIKNLKWITGLNAPKGLALWGRKLFVTDIDALIEIDTDIGKIVNKYPAPGAKFLNDAAADDAGAIYISDSSAENSVIYKFSEGNMAVWLKGNEIKEPNGLFFDRGRLIVGNSGDGKLKAVSIPDKKIHVIAEGLNMIDGIDGDGNGNFIISDWVGRTSLITPDGNVLTLLDTSASKINSADLEYIVEKKLLILTTFSDNRLMAYEIK